MRQTQRLSSTENERQRRYAHLAIGMLGLFLLVISISLPTAWLVFFTTLSLLVIGATSFSLFAPNKAKLVVKKIRQWPSLLKQTIRRTVYGPDVTQRLYVSRGANYGSVDTRLQQLQAAVNTTSLNDEDKHRAESQQPSVDCRDIGVNKKGRRPSPK